jgi:hypothetical protein
VEVGGVLRSDDSGENWQLVEGGDGNPATSKARLSRLFTLTCIRSMFTLLTRIWSSHRPVVVSIARSMAVKRGAASTIATAAPRGSIRMIPPISF